jgi:hypothetical protein
MANGKLLIALKALVTVNLDGKLHTPGTRTELFFASEEDAAPLIACGAAAQDSAAEAAAKAEADARAAAAAKADADAKAEAAAKAEADAKAAAADKAQAAGKKK